MTDFRTLPIERALELIDAWVNAPWPMTMDQGHQLALSLGWRSTALGPKHYISDLSQEKTDSYFTTHNDMVDLVDFPLAIQLTNDDEKDQESYIHSYHAAILKLLKAHYGPAHTSRDGDYKITAWQLFNKLQILLTRGPNYCSVEIDSPAYSELMSDPAGDPNPDETDL